MKLQKGQTLIEVLIALTAAVVIIAAIVSASLSALTSSEFTRDQNTSAQFSQQGMEIIRDMRNESIASLSANYLPDNTYCLADSCTTLNKDISSCWTKLSQCGQNVSGKYVREVTVSHNSMDCNATPTPSGGGGGVLTSNVKITVATYWYDNKCTNSTNTFCHNTIVSTCFSDFTIVPTP